ncbi:MAG: hypothetical protein AB7U83_22510 [Vicinamibacterales bacterium]
MTEGAPGGTAPHRPALALAAVLLGFALQLDNGFYSPAALALVVAAGVAGWAAILAPGRLGQWLPDRPRPLTALLLATVLVQIAILATAPIGLYFAEPMPWQHPGFRPALAVIGAATAAATVGSRAVRMGAAGCILAASAVLGVLTYRGSPHPAIDVVTVHHEAFATLARGESPYSMTFPDASGGRDAFYPPGMVANGRVQYGFPYPPLSLLMAWPGHLAGDFRYAELAALLVGAAAIVAAGRGAAPAVLAAALLLTTPRGYFALEQSWTEPFAVAWLALAAWAASAARPALAAVSIGLAMATKQHLLLAAPAVWHLAASWPTRRRVAGLALAAAALATLPALLDPAGFLHSAVMVQVREELRLDALSLAVPLAGALGQPLPGAVYAVVVAGAAALATARVPSTPSGAFAAVAVALLTAFAFGKKAFCNYYVLVIAVFAIAIAVAREGDDRSA